MNNLMKYLAAVVMVALLLCVLSSTVFSQNSVFAVEMVDARNTADEPIINIYDDLGEAHADARTARAAGYDVDVIAIPTNPQERFLGIEFIWNEDESLRSIRYFNELESNIHSCSIDMYVPINGYNFDFETMIIYSEMYALYRVRYSDDEQSFFPTQAAAEQFMTTLNSEDFAITLTTHYVCVTESDLANGLELLESIEGMQLVKYNKDYYSPEDYNKIKLNMTTYEWSY